jgi:hypothetical protein
MSEEEQDFVKRHLKGAATGITRWRQGSENALILWVGKWRDARPDLRTVNVGDPRELLIGPESWPESEAYCEIPWDDLERRLRGRTKRKR